MLVAMEKPMDGFLSIAQMAQHFGVSAHTLRYYERAGLLAPVHRDAGGRRQYAQRDVAWLAFLMRLRAMGVPIRDMRRYAQLRAAGNATLVERLDLLSEHRDAVAARLASLQDNLAALDNKLAWYRDAIAQSVSPPSTSPGADHEQRTLHARLEDPSTD